MSDVRDILRIEQPRSIQASRGVPGYMILRSHFSSTGKQKSVLLLVDAEAECALIRYLLNSDGFEVSVAESVRSAVAALDSQSPDLILADIRVPDSDGFDLLKIVRDRPELERVPFVFMTVGDGSFSDQPLRSDLGADSFLMKCLEPSGFVSQVNKLILRGRDI